MVSKLVVVEDTLPKLCFLLDKGVIDVVTAPVFDSSSLLFKYFSLSLLDIDICAFPQSEQMNIPSGTAQ